VKKCKLSGNGSDGSDGFHKNSISIHIIKFQKISGGFFEKLLAGKAYGKNKVRHREARSFIQITHSYDN
jgi:hypothetical protein